MEVLRKEVLLLSRVWLYVTPGTVACQAPLSMGFSRQKYWSGLPCHPPGDLPDQGFNLHLRWGNSGNCDKLCFLGLQNHCRWWLSHEIKRHLLLGRRVMINLDSILKSRHYFANKGLSSQSYGFSSSHEWMWELDHKERWVPKNWCFWIVVLEKTLESPLDCKEIQPVHPKGNQSWIFIGRTDAEAETPILWSPDANSWLIWKDPDAGKDWGQEEKGTTEVEMVGWHHQLNGHESE